MAGEHQARTVTTTAIDIGLVLVVGKEGFVRAPELRRYWIAQHDVERAVRCVKRCWIKSQSIV